MSRKKGSDYSGRIWKRVRGRNRGRGFYGNKIGLDGGHFFESRRLAKTEYGERDTKKVQQTKWARMGGDVAVSGGGSLPGEFGRTILSFAQ